MTCLNEIRSGVSAANTQNDRVFVFAAYGLGITVLSKLQRPVGIQNALLSPHSWLDVDLDLTPVLFIHSVGDV